MKNKKILAAIFILVFVFLALTSTNYVFAQNPPVNPPGNPTANGDTNTVNLQNPLSTSDPAEIMANVIKGILGLTGVIALVAFIAGGVIWMTSGGSAEKVKKGRDILVWAVLGLFIVFSSYSILKYVFDILG